MRLTIFAPLVGAVLMGIGLVIGALDLGGQTLELFVSSIIYYEVPGLLWLGVSVLILKLIPLSAGYVWGAALSRMQKVLLVTLTILAWVGFGVLHVLFFNSLFGRTELLEPVSMLGAAVVMVLIPACILGLIERLYVRRLARAFPSLATAHTVPLPPSITTASAQATASATAYLAPVLGRVVLQTKKTAHFLLMQAKTNVWFHRAVLLAVLAGIFYGVWLFTRPVELSYSNLNDEYELVQEGIPLDGPIIVRLPEGATSPFSRFNVSISPEVKTYWGRSGESGYLVFRLREDMLENDFYTLTYTDRDDVEHVRTFKAVQRPKVELFEPQGGAVSENTVLTFMFNRPMIPLESLDRTYEKELPITISPPTPGTFQWVSQRQLEFVPETRLRRSSNYTVMLGENFRTTEGLVVPPATYTFTVRPLSYQGAPSSLRVQDPLVFRFNQPVDIDAFSVGVFDEEGQSVAIEKQYTSSFAYNFELERKEEVIDRSQIVVQPVENEGRWNFASKYKYQATNIRPLEGDITVKDQQGLVYVRPLLMRHSVHSKRTDFVKESYFDPAGTLQLHFSEPVDPDMLEVTGKGIASVEYAPPCGELVPAGECEKPVDESIVVVRFDPRVFGFKETFDISIGAVYSKARELLGTLTTTITLTTYGDLEIWDVQLPAEESLARQQTICTTNPLIAYDDETFDDLIASSYPLDDFYRTSRSQYVRRIENPGPFTKQPWCAGGYTTNVRYKLAADTTYTLTLKPTDIFGNSASYTLDVTTPPAKEKSVVTDPWLDNLHRQYTVTTPDKTRYTYTAGNIEYVQVQICKLEPAEMISVMGTLKREDPGPTNCAQSKEFTLSLPGSIGPDYFQINLADYFDDVRGHYVITVTHPELDIQRYNKDEFVQFYDHMYTSVTNLSLVEKRTNRHDLTRDGYVERKTNLLDSGAETNLYWVSDLRTLEPKADAQVFVYRDESPDEGIQLTLETSARTDAEGIARSKVVPDPVGAYVVSGDDSAIVTDWGDDLTYASRANEAERVYLYTDRPIYRPGDEVGIKGIHRIGYDGSFEILQAEDLYLEILDARRAVIHTEQVSINEYGTFSDIVRIPEDAPLGTYSLRLKTEDSKRQVGYSSFSVEEYVGAPFEVTASTEQEEYIAGDTMHVTIDAQYFFGAPLPEGTVSYTVSTQDYFFDRSKDRRFHFGGNWYHCWHCSSYDRFLSRGEGALEGGTFTFEQSLDFDTLFARDEEDEEEQQDRLRSKIFVVSATVKDANGKSVSSQESFIVHRAENYVAVKSANRLVETNTPTSLSVKTVDTQGESTSNDVTVVIKKREWKEFKRREVDGSFYTQSELVRREIARQELTTDGDGYAMMPFIYPEPGQYEITVQGIDSRGNPFSERINQYVYGKDTAPVRRYNDRTLDIAVENTDLAIGERSKLIIQSPYEHAKALITVERGSVMDYEIVDVDANFFDYDFVAKEEYAPNVVTSVVLLSNDPSVKYGTVRFAVDRQVHSLDITVASNKEVYLPGEEVTLYVETKDWQGHGVPAEVSIAAVDLSILALKGNPEKDPLLYFYQGFPHSVITSSNLKFVHSEVEIPTGTKGGGGTGEDLTRRERGTFKDTAFWEAAVATDADGRATVRFTLPDNLTRWRVETIGVTKDTKVGVDYMEFTQRKDLITTPLIPRFVLPGDTVSLGAEILNRSDTTQQVSFTVESEEMGIDSAPQYVSIPPKEAKRLFVETTIPRETDLHNFTVRFSAENAALEDTIVKTIPIEDNIFYESVFLANFTDGREAVEQIYTPSEIHEDFGGLRVKAFTTVGAYLEDSVNYMSSYPYGCSEQLASKIATLATAQYLATLENLGEEYSFAEITHRDRSYTVEEAIDEGLGRIYEAQNEDGGFGYYSTLRSDIALTLHIISILKTLERVDVVIDQKVLEQAVGYIAQEANKRENREALADTRGYMSKVFVTAYNLRDINPRPRAVDTAIQDIRTMITRKSVRQMRTQDLAYAALLSDELWWFDRWSVWHEVKKRLRETPDGLYVRKGRGTIAKSYYETDVKNAAIVLRAITEHDRLINKAPELLRWILAQRSNDGAWSTTNTTHEVVQTLAQYVVWKDEQHAAQVLTLFLDGGEVATHNPATEARLEGLTYEEGYPVLGMGAEHTLTFEQADAPGRNDTMYYDIAMRYALDREVLPSRDEGVYVERAFYALDDIDYENPITSSNVGDVVVGRVTYTVRSPMRMVGFEDRIPAGFETINFDYATENREMIDAIVKNAEAAKTKEKEADGSFLESEAFAAMEATAQVYKDDREYVRPSYRSYVQDHRSSYEELHDDRIFTFSENIRPGVYVHEYYLRALVPGTYQHLPVQIGEMYDPSFFGRTEGSTFTVRPKE